MKLGAVYVLFDDTEFLELSLDSVAKASDKVLFLVNKHPWNNQESAPNNQKTIDKLKEICSKNNKCEMTIGDWSTEEEQRNDGLKLLIQKDIDYCLIVDTDELYHLEQLFNLRRAILENKDTIAFHCFLNTYWKKFYRIEPREPFTPLIAVRCKDFRFTIRRQGICLQDGIETKYRSNLLSEHIILLYHLSYARSDEFIQQKIKYFSHSNEVLENWFNEKWLNWTLETKDFHPVKANQYHSVVVDHLLYLPEALRNFLLLK